MTKEDFKKILKANCYVASDSGHTTYVFGEGDIELCAQELDHKVNNLNL